MVSNNVTTEELLGLFEALEQNDDKIDQLKEQIKVIKYDSKGQIKEFAKGKDVKPADLEGAWKYFKSQKKNLDSGESDYMELCALVDALIEEN